MSKLSLSVEKPVQLTLSLDEIAADIHAVWAETKAHQIGAWEGYFRVGADLNEARSRFPSKNKYGAWFDRQEFGFSTEWGRRLGKLSSREDEARALIATQVANSVNEVVALLRAGDHEERRAAVLEAIEAEPSPLPEGPFRVIVADPPWRYESTYDPRNRRVANPYPDLSLAEIAAFGEQVQAVAHSDSILWLWTTNAHLEYAFGICRDWGFEPKTILTWAKDRMGVGDWLRGQTEHCLMGVRGHPLVTLTNQTTLLRGPLREHSRKPDEFYALVEALCPGSKLEMFAREPRAGWMPWGAEAPAA
jgi:N6-adenosine-specific RNA methylase IME4